MLQKKRKRSNFGSLAEDLAVTLLKESGYKIIDRNFRSRFGEIDIIAIQDDTLVFVEVKARSSTRFGSPEESVTPSKLTKIKITGEYYAMNHPGLPQKLRIDVAALVLSGNQIISSKIIKVGS